MSSTSSGSHHVRNDFDVMTSASASFRSRPAPPKWSMWLWVTTTVWMSATLKPAAANLPTMAL
jgi:hypothetical protein